MKQIFFLLVLLLTLAGVANACPMCKESIPNSDVTNPANVGGGFNNSVFLMLGTLLAVLTLISGVIYKGVSDSNRFNAIQKEKADLQRTAQA